MANALGYRPKVSDEKKVYGVGTVKAGKASARVTIFDHDRKTGMVKKNADGTPVVIFTEKFGLSDLPSVPKIAPESEGEYNIVISRDKASVEKLGPAEGHALAKLKDFCRPEEGAAPEFYVVTKKNQNQEEYSYREFWADFTILKGKFKNVDVRIWLRYIFEEDPDNEGFARWAGNPDNPNAIHLPKLINFCDKLGMIDEDIEWPEDGNLLPELLRRGLEAGKIVDLSFKNGFISDIMAADYEEIETPPAKAAGKSTKAKKAVAPEQDEVDPDDDL